MGQTEHTTELYFESHITIEPVFDKDRDKARVLAKSCNFKLAKLLMQKRKEDLEERSKHDTFMTGHSKDWEDILSRTVSLVKLLNSEGFKVWRYKIENTLLDSKFDDTFELLELK